MADLTLGRQSFDNASCITQEKKNQVLQDILNGLQVGLALPGDPVHSPVMTTVVGGDTLLQTITPGNTTPTTILNITDDTGGGGGGGTTLTIFKATVNDGTHVTGSDGTFDFDGTTAIVGSAPASGTCTNIYAQAFIDNELILVVGDATPTYFGIKLRPTIASALVNQSGGVPLSDSTFPLDGFTAILGTVPSTGTADNSVGSQYANNQFLKVLLKDNGQWYVLKEYDMVLAKVTTGITARSGTYTWGSGVATLLKKTGTATHSATGGTTSVTIYNSTTQTAATNDVIQCKRIDGEWFWDVGDCA